jgi:hypothetical protein
MPRGYWKELRMTQSSLAGVFGAHQAQVSFDCIDVCKMMFLY